MTPQRWLLPIETMSFTLYSFIHWKKMHWPENKNWGTDYCVSMAESHTATLIKQSQHSKLSHGTEKSRFRTHTPTAAPLQIHYSFMVISMLPKKLNIYWSFFGSRGYDKIQNSNSSAEHLSYKCFWVSEVLWVSVQLKSFEFNGGICISLTCADR